MSVIRKAKRSDYTSIANALFEDPRISLDLKGFLGYCLTRPDDWVFYATHLTKILNIGKDKLYRIINEGISFGYIERENQRLENGKFSGCDYVVHESPVKNISTVADFQDAAVPLAATPQLLNTELILNTDITKESTGSPKGGSYIRLKDHPKQKEKEPDLKTEVDTDVHLTQKQVSDFLKKCDGNEEFAKRCYRKLSEWKIGKLIGPRANDYLALVRWVFDAVKQDFSAASSSSKTSFSNIEINRKSTQSAYIHLQSINRSQEMRITKDYVVCVPAKEYIYFSLAPETFIQLICKYFNLTWSEQCSDQIQI